jgi:predicted nucleotidyltransferase
MTKEWTEYLEILSEMKTTADVQRAYKKQGDEFMKVLSMGGNKSTAPYTLPRPPRGKSGLGPMEEAENVVPEIKEDLNRDIWDENNQLNAEISDKLLAIAEDFYYGLDLDAPVLDITFTGSMANYNWTEKSDIDLHIVIDYTAIDEDYELIKKYLAYAKTIWNRNHEIMIKGHEVEVYIQDVNEPHYSTGVYSVLKDEWLIEPERAEFQVSEEDIKKKIDYFENIIELISKLDKENKYEEAYGEADRLADKIRMYRQSGLEQGGEYSVENIVFKNLRNSDEIGKLFDIKGKAYDAIMTIQEHAGT